MTCIRLIQEVALNYPFRQIIFVQVEGVEGLWQGELYRMGLYYNIDPMLTSF